MNWFNTQLIPLQGTDAWSTSGKSVHYVLRFASAMCFIGHGVWGILQKSSWLNYFLVFGIDRNAAMHLMPILGMVDIFFGVALIFYPVRIIVVWLVVWGFITALLRPLSGEPLAEFMERAGNYGAPLALLLLYVQVDKTHLRLFHPLNSSVTVDAGTILRLKTCLRIICFLLLAGHGWLNLIEKKGLLAQYAALGVSNPQLIAHCLGVFEILAALTILIRPLGPLLLIMFIWKVFSELYYPQHEIFEWLERGGSYGSLLALWLILRFDASRQKWYYTPRQLLKGRAFSQTKNIYQ